jgi:uncharacterized cupin superfamily protein
MRISTCLLCLFCCLPVFAGDVLHPVTMSQDQIAGSIWKDFTPVEETEGGVTTSDVEIFRSKAEDFDAGMWRSSEAHWDIDSYPYNEYIHVLDGSITLTSADGTVTDVQPGNSVVIPLGWKGRWDSPGVTKIYVIHAPNTDH